MKKTLLSILLALALPGLGDACTNVIVTRGASKDGSVLVSYAADSHYLFGELYYHPAADWKAGEMLKVYDWDTNRYLTDIPQVAHTYQTVGNMNEHQLIITETTWGGRSELEDKLGKIDYGSLIYITLQRAKTAREAIGIIVDLANTYGYASEGESFTIADKNEVWIMELIGKGMNIRNKVNTQKGIVWVAVRIPDGAISGHANQARIGKFPLNDPDNCLYAPDVISFARRKGYFDGEDSEFSFKKAYGPADFGTVRGCDARVWSAFNLLTDGWFSFYDETGRGITKDAYTWLDYVMGKNLEKDLPLYVYPRRKIGVKDVADVMRDHFEGSPMDMTQDIGAGGNALPYRWRPMEWEFDGKTYVNERAIATQQTGFWMVGQARDYVPDVVGGILWFGTDDAATSYLTPIYTATTAVPECFRQGNGDLLHYSLLPDVQPDGAACPRADRRLRDGPDGAPDPHGGQHGGGDVQPDRRQAPEKTRLQGRCDDFPEALQEHREICHGLHHQDRPEPVQGVDGPGGGTARQIHGRQCEAPERGRQFCPFGLLRRRAEKGGVARLYRTLERNRLPGTWRHHQST